MKKPKQHQKPQLWQTILYFLAGIFVGTSILIAVARLTWHSTYYPGVRVGGVGVAGLTREEAKTKLESAVGSYSLSLTYNGASWVVPTPALSVDTVSALTEAYRYGRRLKISDYLWLLLGHTTDYPLSPNPSQAASLESWLEEITPGIEIPAAEPSLELSAKKIIVHNGTDGHLIDRDALRSHLANQLGRLDTTPLAIPTKTVTQELSHTSLETLQQRGEKLLTTSLLLTFEDERITLTTKDLLPFLYTGADQQLINEIAIRSYLETLSEGFNRPAQNAKFVFADNQVKEFAPGRDGVEMQVEPSTRTVADELTKLLTTDDKTASVALMAQRTPPSVTTDKVNDLGIRERIGRGESYYAHSIPNRVYNVGLAASRTQSALIAPGEEYSFNREVGEISGGTGYKTAYVISGGRTVLGDGGGVCQVSTTLFRAAMNAGLPIVERWAHAYRVGYYEQNSKPGIDATVYSPSKDFRFKNDTPGSILIQTINDPKTLHLIVEIYGTSDGRVSSVSEPKIWGIAPPPPDIYQDDPSLPAGTVKQVDWAAGGAKTSFEYKVTRDGETIQEKTFTSNYRPWQNVYLRGTGQ